MFAQIRNPPFNQTLRAAAATLQSKPPTRFDGVTARVFPLRANMHRLAVFCEAYLNVAPEITRFRPAMPYVYLMAMDYGKMSVEAGNLGWVSQHEVAFAVPLEWRRPDGVVDQAIVCPFIFVDDELSLSTGRQVYGWPKVRAWLSGDVNPWITDPCASAPLMLLSTMVYPELFAGKRQEPKVLLEIQQQGMPALSRVPPALDDPLGPLAGIPRAAQAYLDLLGGFVEMVVRPPLLGYARGRAGEVLPDAQQLTRTLMGALTQTPSISNITLKQFRDAEHPMRICYQALVESEMRVERFNAGGLLGEARLAAGDPSGGHRILLRHYAAQPIVESLGLQVAEEIVVDDAGASILMPVFPFWVGVDLRYGVGNPICWRTAGTAWQSESAAASSRAPEVSTAPPPGANDRQFFNTTLGAALQDVTGPFEFPNVTIRVLPLMADSKRLEDFCASYLDNPFYTFEAWGSYVYLAISSYEEMSSATDSIGWWADRELTFFVPVKRKARDGGLLSVGLVPAFTFTNTDTAAITGSEVNGKPTFRATLKSPPVAWMRSGGPADETSQTLLTLETMILPVLGFGQKAEERTLLEVRHSNALPSEEARRAQVAEHWADRLHKDHEAKRKTKAEHPQELRDAQVLALEVLANRRRINTFTLKQFRDSADPDRACYQSIVQGRQVINSVYDLREIDQLLHVAIGRYPNLPVTEILGLRRMGSEMRGTVAVDIMQPVRPFWMHVSLREDPATNMCWRAGSEVWQLRQGDDGLFAPAAASDRHGGLSLGRELADRLDGLSFTAVRASSGTPLSRDDAKRALDTIEPQLVVESLLTACVGNMGSTEWCGADRALADFWIRCDAVGPSDGPGSPGAMYFPIEYRTHDGRWYSKEPRRTRPDSPD